VETGFKRSGHKKVPADGTRRGLIPRWRVDYIGKVLMTLGSVEAEQRF
jgi:hypothetical protein